MASTRMSRDLIGRIVANALKATNLDAEREEIIADTKKRVHKILLAKVDPELVKLAEKHPREWFCWQDQVYAQHGDYNPIAIVSAGLHSPRRDSYLPVEPSIPIPGHSTVGLKADKDLADLIQRATAWATKKYEAEMELRRFLASCSTVQKAIERMPEIEAHVPPAAVKVNHPIVASSNALSALTKLGFDTTAKA